MYTKINGQDLETPRAFLVAMDRVVEVTLTAIRRNEPERIVAAVPIRPMFALAQAFPRLGARLAMAGGAPSFFRQAADRARVAEEGDRG